MEALRTMFPDTQAYPIAFVLFSIGSAPGGVPGGYETIEHAEQGLVNSEPDQEEKPSVTFCVIKPCLVCMQYGNAKPENADDINFLKELRASGLIALASIGY